MVCVIASIAEGRGFDPRLGLTKTIKLVLVASLVRTQDLRSKSKDWLALDQNIMFELRVIFSRRMYFQ